MVGGGGVLVGDVLGEGLTVGGVVGVGRPGGVDDGDDVVGGVEDRCGAAALRVMWAPPGTSTW